MKKRIQQYKLIGDGSTWTEKLTKFALKRMKEKRIDLYDKLRQSRRKGKESDGKEDEDMEKSLVNEISTTLFSNEFDKEMECEVKEIPRSGGEDDWDELDFDLLTFMEEIIMKEMEEEDKFLASQYEAMMESEMNSLAASMDGIFLAQDSEEDCVLCPVCKKYPLRQKGSVILCMCKFRLNVQNDHLTLINLRESLSESFSSHREKCSYDPNFLVINEFEIEALYMECEFCNIFKAVF